MEKVRLGIAGPGRIVRRVMKDLRRAEHIEVKAVASRNADRAKQAAEELNIPLVFTGYEDMANSDQVDLVYIAIPHPFHCETAKLFLEHGKHVIVEKPFAINAREAQEMVDCAKKNGCFLMEAMWTRFFPMALELRDRIRNGDFGVIRRITGDFASNAAFDPDDRTFKKELGGGSLLDIGVYPLSMMNFYKGMQPEKIQVLSTLEERTMVDDLCSFQLQYADGSVGQGFSALNVGTDHELKLYGTTARVEVRHFWHGCNYTVYRRDKDPEVTSFEEDNEGFYHEFEYAARCILRGETDQDVIPLAETVSIMKQMDDMRAVMGVVYPADEQ